MLKRARAVSPGPSGSSYDDDSEDERRRTKRVRFATGDTSSCPSRDRNARQERGIDEELATEDDIARGRRVVGGNPEEPLGAPQRGTDTASDDGSSDEDERSSSSPPQRYSKSPPPPDHTPPPSSAFSEYASINSLLGALNRSRTSHHQNQNQGHKSIPVTPPTISRGDSLSDARHRLGVSAPRAKGVLPPVTAPVVPNRQGQHPNLGVLGWRHSRATAHRHRPSVPSPLARATVADEEDDEADVELAGKWESQAVRQRYEDTNKLLKALVLSRRAAPEEDDENDGYDQ